MKITSIILASSIFLALSSCNPDTGEEVTVKVGAILDLSGDISEVGLASKAAIELSMKELNQLYADAESPVKFTCEYADTRMDTSLTIAAIKKMYDSGIRMLVAGPTTSAELRAIKSFVDSKQMLVLNSFSTAPSLAIENDYIFRLQTDDNVQGRALVKMMQYDSIKVLIPIWREDTYGSGLYQSIKQRFQDSGGIVMPGVAYSPVSTNIREITAEAAAQVKSTLASYNRADVGVLLIAYQEALDFLKAADSEADLAKVKWYGCDGNVQRVTITADPTAARFAETVQFKGPIMGIGTASKVPQTAKKIMDDVSAIAGFYPDYYCIHSYDAVQILGQAYNIVRSYNHVLIKNILLSVCESYNYAGISRKLNPAGDLETANYIFYTIRSGQSGYVWDSYATYMAEGDFILFK